MGFPIMWNHPPDGVRQRVGQASYFVSLSAALHDPWRQSCASKEHKRLDVSRGKLGTTLCRVRSSSY